MTKPTLIRDVYLDGFLIPTGTELTEDQAKRITNPKAVEDLAIKGQDGKSGDDDEEASAPDKGSGDSEAPARRAAAKPAAGR